MSPKHRICLATAVVMALAGAVTAAAEPQALDQSKREVVRSTLVQLGRLDGNGPLIEAAAQAHALLEIRAATAQENPIVRVRTTGEPEYKAFAIANENKVVLDVADTVNLRYGQTIAPDDPSLLRQVRTSLYGLEPQFISRVVLDLAAPCTFSVSREGETIAITLTRKDGAAPRPERAKPVPAKAPERAAAPETPPEVQREQVVVPPEIQPEQAAPVVEEKVSPTLLARAYDRASSGVSVALDSGSALLSRGRDTWKEWQQQYVEQQARLAQESPAASTPPPDAHSDAMEDHITQLAEQLERVQASQFELTQAPEVSFTIIALDTSLTPVTPTDEPPAEPEKASETALAGEKPAPEKPAAENPAPPQAPEEAPAAPAAPAAPDKRAGAAEKPAPAQPGVPVLSRMKQLVSGMAAAAKGTEDSGITAANPDAAPLKDNKVVSGKAKGGAHAAPPPIAGDPMEQIVNIDFREMDLTNVVALLAQKARINIIAGTDLSGTVTASLKNVRLRQAIDTVLRMNNLGLVEEEGIYRIVPYEEAMAARRTTVMVKLDNAKAKDLRKTLEDVTKGSPDDTLISISENEASNILVIAGPEARVNELEKLAKQLDVAKPVTPTITEAIKLNNAEPKEVVDLVKSMLTKEIGKASLDERTRHVVVTDAPVVVEQVRELINQIDSPVKQVSIDTMIVDAVLSNDAETGVDWILNSMRTQNLRGIPIGSLVGPNAEVDATGETITRGRIGDMITAGTGQLTLGLLNKNFDLKGAITAQVNKRNAKLLANPVVVTVENKKATISITDEIPYQESKQSLTGPPMVSTAFKDIGIILEVTPRVTHDDHVIAQLMAKQSRQNGTFNAIPIEAKRLTETTLRSRNGQTIFIGGLRRRDDTTQSTKVPLLGDIPVMNILFRNNNSTKQSTELLVFLTCNVLPDDAEKIDTDLQNAHDEIDVSPKEPNAEKDIWRMMTHPREVQDPSWKWRRSK